MKIVGIAIVHLDERGGKQADAPVQRNSSNLRIDTAC
jgi:hypothetical protein